MCKPVNFTIINRGDSRWEKGQPTGIYINGTGFDRGTVSIFQSISIPLQVSTHRLFHSFYEEMEHGPPPILAKTKSLFIALAEIITQRLMVNFCSRCGETNMRDQWPWEDKELDPQRPFNNSGEPAT